MHMDMDEVGGPTMKTTTIKNEKAQQEVVEEEIQGMTSHVLNATIVRNLDIMLLNVELQSILKLKRRPIMLKKKAKKMVFRCWLMWKRKKS